MRLGPFPVNVAFRQEVLLGEDLQPQSYRLETRGPLGLGSRRVEVRVEGAVARATFGRERQEIAVPAGLAFFPGTGAAYAVLPCFGRPGPRRRGSSSAPCGAERGWAGWGPRAASTLSPRARWPLPSAASPWSSNAFVCRPRAFPACSSCRTWSSWRSWRTIQTRFRSTVPISCRAAWPPWGFRPAPLNRGPPRGLPGASQPKLPARALGRCLRPSSGGARVHSPVRHRVPSNHGR